MEKKMTNLIILLLAYDEMIYIGKGRSQSEEGYTKR